MSTKRIAISGASGLIGKEFVRQLLGPEFQLHRLVRRESRSNDCSSFASSIPWDPVAGLAEPECVSGFDAVVHLAGRSIGEKRWNEREKRLIRDSRVQATRVLSDQLASLPQPPQVFVCGSAVGIYGDKGSEILTEDSAAGSDFLSDVAVQWEAASSALSKVTRVVHARFGIVLDPAGGALAKMLPLFRVGLGGKLGDGTQYMSWISLADCSRALRYLILETELEGPFNFVAPSPVTNAEFTRELAQALSRPALLPAPSFLLRLVLGEMADALLLSSCRATPSRLVEAGFQFESPELRGCLHRILSN